jgi:ribosome maturation factor RimP
VSERNEDFGVIADDRLTPVAEAVRPVIEAMGHDLVRVGFGGDAATIDVMTERADGARATIDEYTALSRAVSAALDAHDPVAGGAYRLEVGSPGIDRPLTRFRDFTRWAGFEAKVETANPLNGQSRFRGRIAGIDDDAVALATESGDVRLPLAELKRARLVLNDQLLAAAKHAA